MDFNLFDLVDTLQRSEMKELGRIDNRVKRFQIVMKCKVLVAQYHNAKLLQNKH